MKCHFVFIMCVFICYSCIKKKAIKVDSELVGVWVSNDDGYATWLIIEPNGHAIYRTYDKLTYGRDSKYEGIAKYSLFEKKFYVGNTKFQVLIANTGHTDGVTEIKTKSYNKIGADTTYHVDRKFRLKTSILHGSRIINFYKSK